MTPSLKSVHHTYGLREVCCSSTKESVHVYRCLKCEGYVVQDSTHDALQISPELFSPIHTSLIIKKKCTRVLPATFSPKGNPKAFVQLHRKDRVFCNKKKKKKNNQENLSRRRLPLQDVKRLKEKLTSAQEEGQPQLRSIIWNLKSGVLLLPNICHKLFQYCLSVILQEPAKKGSQVLANILPVLT